MAKRTQNKVAQIDQDVFYVGHDTVMEFANTDRISNNTKGSDDTNPRFEWVQWYNNSKNLEPDRIIRLLTSNNINPSILDTKRDFIIGSGVKFYKKVFTEGKAEMQLLDPNKYPVEKEWFERNRIDHVKTNQAKDLLWFGNYFGGARFQGRGKSAKIDKVWHLDASVTRCGLMNTEGVIDKYYICDDWTNPHFDASKPNSVDNNVKQLNAFDAENPYNAYPSFVFHGKDYVPGYPYYSLPSWYGAWTWIELANKIPAWHLNGMINGYNIKYHIKIPLSYFDKFPPEKHASEKAKLRDEFNNFLAGEKNVGKAFVSFKKKSGIETDEWTIETIKAELHDEAFTQLFVQSNMAMTSAHAMQPALAGVQLPNALSNASELREGYITFLSLKVPAYRRLLLEDLYYYKKINGWAEELEFGFENIMPTTLDVNPTGQQKVMVGMSKKESNPNLAELDRAIEKYNNEMSEGERSEYNMTLLERIAEDSKRSGRFMDILKAIDENTK